MYTCHHCHRTFDVVFWKTAGGEAVCIDCALKRPESDGVQFSPDDRDVPKTSTTEG